MNINTYTVLQSDSFYTVLNKINENRKGFVIVVDADLHAVGTLTDGDVRRAFLQSKRLNDNISESFNKNFKNLNINDSINDAIEIFKNEKIKFLPILDNSNKLINVITKNQMHAILLQDISVDLFYDFQSIDENIIDYEIYQRPWGFYKTTVMNSYFQSKIISVKPKAQLSLQSHQHREEYWIVAHGKGIVQLDESFITVQCGSSIFIPKSCKHRLINIDNKDSLIITEVQIGDYFGEDDIYRYEDIYGRV